ncbi:hypothetical protein ASE82_08330 [Sphingomonas sp. Leaf230]|uniref:hypothetical protein n=1 Tax=Sphingomonas sp. Leaf230 TaxID=1735694 RepID=UPI0006FE6F9F|nr:hypothetical protein [Sphingomonas sp. Leaf230]KQN02356.1 hypothetical protein ASE82_08330 [Sphingomonas sp. Leaf230]
MTRVEIREEPGSLIWEVTGADGKVFYEVKCGVHRLLRFETEIEANAHFDRWAPEAENDLEAFGR